MKTVRGKGKNRRVTYTRREVRREGGGFGFDPVAGFGSVFGGEAKKNSEGIGFGVDTKELENSLGMGSPKGLAGSLGYGRAPSETDLGLGVGPSRKKHKKDDFADFGF